MPTQDPLLEKQREQFIENLKTEFVSIAAHQLRTPLSAIKWIIRMLMDEDIGPLTNEQKDYLTKAYLNNERMIKLINDLLNVSKIEEGKFLNKTASCDLIAVLKEAVVVFEEAAKRKGLFFKVIFPKKKVSCVNIDKEKIILVLHNLIENSLKYTDKGGIEVKVELEKSRGQFLISVKDSGYGIPAEEKDRIFSRFFRASNASKVDTEGTGLGLYIAKHIVQQHNGKIWFESEEGKGTAFYFTLPVR